ncbi:MAG: hypothetical protein IT366_08530 [Candidatus Hydrogenedentes bacterium]|nr:hypothetical protein [Candidatus Hydrogenedentota bacterium]
MDPINRNDPYETANPVALNAITRNDSYGTVQAAPSRPQDPFYVFRVAGVVAGIVVVLAGVYFAGASFMIVRDILEEPQRLNAYLDEWYIPPREELPSPEPAKNAPEPAPPAAVAPAEAPAPTTPPPATVPIAATTPAPTAEVSAPGPDNAAAKPSTPAAPQSKLLLHKNTRRASNNDSPVSEAIELITDALTRGGLPRLAGALILLLLASMLFRIPFGLLKAGIELIRAMIPERSKNTP